MTKLFDLAQLPITVPNVGLPIPKSVELPLAGKFDLRGVDHIAEETLTRGSELIVNGVLAVMIFVIGWFLAIAVMNLLQRAMMRAKVDEIVASFVGSMVRYAIVFSSLLMVMVQFGVPTATIVTIFGAIGLAIALGLKDTLSDAAAGMMLLLTRPFTVKDYIQTGDFKGSVKRITLFKTEINTSDNMRVFIPNHQIWTGVLHNHTYNRTRMVEVFVGVSYTDTTQRTMEVLRELVGSDVRVLNEPAPQIGVWELADSAVVYRIRAWVKTLQYQDVRMTILQLIRDGLEREGLSIPFPQRVVHLVHAPTPPAPTKKPLRKRKA